MRLFLHFLRALAVVLLAAVAFVGLWIGYLALPAVARTEVLDVIAQPVPVWIPVVLALILVAVIVTLVNVQLESEGRRPDVTPEQAASFAQELTSGLTGSTDRVIWADDASLEQSAYLAALLEQFVESSVSRPRQEAVDFWVGRITNLPDITYALLDTLSRGRHLKGEQVSQLRKSDLFLALQRLRREGLIVPVTQELSGETVYWLPGDDLEAIREAIDLVTAPMSSSRVRVANVLRSVDYDLPESIANLVDVDSHWPA